MSEQNGLVLVVPRRFDRLLVPSILERHELWIDRARRRLSDRSRRLEAEPRVLPTTVSLSALGEEWTVEYVVADYVDGRVVARHDGDMRLQLKGNVASAECCRQALRRWLIRRARVELPLRLREVAQLGGLQFGAFSVRLQRARWGSCSKDSRISLNAKLLFLSPSLVDYVLLHELCHTVHMDHSAEFWGLVETLDPHYRAKRKALSGARERVPRWPDHPCSAVSGSLDHPSRTR